MTQMIKARSRYCRSIRFIGPNSPLESLVIRFRALELRVLVPGLPTEGTENVERSPYQRLGLPESVGVHMSNFAVDRSASSPTSLR